MSTEAWFRNPDNYVRELIEVGECNVVWDRGYILKRNIDPEKHASLYFGKAFPYRIMIAGLQGTVELRDGYSLENPFAVYPTWGYGESSELLEEIISNPVGNDREICDDYSVLADERPVFGQEHRVIITDLPPSNTGAGRQFLKYLRELNDEYSDVIIHIHGLYSWRVAFGMGWGAADVEPRTLAAKGKINLPSGKEELYERAQGHAQWVTALGFKPADLAVPRNRCMYNIKSAVWAGKNYEILNKFKSTADSDPVDANSSDADFKPVTTSSYLTKQMKVNPGDRFECNSCSLQNTCKYYREGSVCSVPGAETKELARFFKTRDAQSIVEGLGQLVARNTKRAERGMEYEEAFDELNSETTKVIGQVFDQAVKLAKLIDPSLRGTATAVQVNVGAGGAAAVSTGDPRQLVASAIRELEQRGYTRDQITPDLIKRIVSPQSDPEPIVGSVVRNEK